MKDTQLEPEERSVIAAARDAHHPTDAQRARVRKGLAVKLAAGVAVPLLATSSAMAMVGKVGAGLALLAVVGTTAAYVAKSGPARKVLSPQVHQPPAPVAKSMLAADPVPAPAPPTTVEPSTMAPKDSHPNAVRPRVSTPRRAPVSTAPADLAGELALLTQISDATKRGDVARAERLLADYDQRTLSPQLAQERAAAGILLECAAGRTASARAQARRFMEHWPRSPLVARINSSCIAEAKTP